MKKETKIIAKPTIKEIRAQIADTVRKMNNKPNYVRLREYNRQLTLLLNKYDRAATSTARISA